jgi:uncharacterized protein (TIGR04222 family)
MNLFDLSGPDFLLAYLVICLAAIIFLRLGFRLLEGGRPAGLPLGQPEQIAWLCGGPPRAVGVAVLSLVDRGALAIDGKWMRRCDPAGCDRRQALEAAIFDLAERPLPIGQIGRQPSVRAVCDGFRQRLAGAGLTPGGGLWFGRILMIAVAISAVVAVAAAKALLALDRGRPNIDFLIVMATVAVCGLLLQAGRRTRRADRALADLRKLGGDAARRAAAIRPGQTTRETALLAAMFGLQALPEDGFWSIRRAFRTVSEEWAAAFAGCCRRVRAWYSRGGPRPDEAEAGEDEVVRDDGYGSSGSFFDFFFWGSSGGSDGDGSSGVFGHFSGGGDSTGDSGHCSSDSSGPSWSDSGSGSSSDDS